MELDKIGEYVKEVQDGGTLAVITEDRVAPLYLDRCLRSLRAAGFRTAEMVLPAGEATKNGGQYLDLLEFCAEVPLTRTDGIVALGGGMVGDLAGFTAATFLRGIRVIQVPTTLLAAVDSSVGGKTAIVLPAGKNLAGAFHQPALVVQDPSLLDSLPEDIFRDGMAEVIKYGIIADLDLFSELGDPAWVRAHIGTVIDRCVSIKKSFVEADEFDRGLRHMLNFGHTIGHAVEQLSRFTISHGSAVAIGMARMAEISAAQSWCSEEDRDRIRALLRVWGFDLAVPYPKEAVFRALCADKKRENGGLSLVTLDRIGACRIRPLPLEEVEALL